MTGLVRTPRVTNGKRKSSSAIRADQDSALDMRITGHTLSHIAETIGWASEAGARKAIAAALLRRVPDEDRQEYFRLAQARLDEYARAATEHAMANPTEALPALRIMLDIERRRAALTGVDGAVKVDVTVAVVPEADTLGWFHDRVERVRATHPAV